MPDAVGVISIWADIPLGSPKLEFDLVIDDNARSTHLQSPAFNHNATWITYDIGDID